MTATRLPRRAKPLRDWTEKELDAALFGRQKGLARQCGWELSFHVLRSRGSLAGFPDRCLVRAPRTVFVETKTRLGKPSPEQVKWLTELARCQHEVYLWTPLDMDEAGRILAARRRPVGAVLASAWLPEGYRADEAP